MLIVLSNSFDPFLNLATEEFLLKHKTEDIFMLWRSAPAVVVGKHQNAMAEINYRYIRENNITLARRLSGGGTVVHDLENLNFTFITNGEDGKLIDFKKFVSPIIEYLATLGIKAQMGKTNDIRIGDLKISGNAEHVFRNRVLHHGTLLFNSDLDQLRQAINVQTGKYFDKAVQSNRASVTNISSFLQTPMDINSFTKKLTLFIKKNTESTEYELSAEDKTLINELKESKYQTPEWIWGYSPRYTFKNSFSSLSLNWKIALHVEKGVITDFQLSGNNYCSKINLEGIPHNFDSIFNTLAKVFNSYSNNELTELTYKFF